MRRSVSVVVSSALVLVAAGVADASSARPPWHGNPDAEPAAYSWLSGDNPSDTYTITIVRGERVGQVLEDLGGVKKDLGDVPPGKAGNYVIDHLDKFYEGPPVVQVDRLGPAVVIYEPYDFRANDRIAQLSAHGTVASFFTTVELDTYVTVARRGKTLRSFDAGFEPPKRGALPQEDGLDWGSRHQNIFATAWAFDERITRIHIAEGWFEQPHSTYVLN